MIKLQILLRKQWRNPEGVERVRGLAESLGMKVTGSGLTTVSAEMAGDEFAALFGSTPRSVDPRPPKDRDFGRSGGHVAGDLRTPEPLREYVESITTATPYLRM